MENAYRISLSAVNADSAVISLGLGMTYAEEAATHSLATKPRIRSDKHEGNGGMCRPQSIEAS